MKGIAILILLVAIAPPGPAQVTQPSPAREPAAAETAAASAPTLEDAVRIFASVDRDDVYLGESLTLLLEYWELNFRGVKIQSLYRSGALKPPDTEGFYAGEPRSETREATRDGALYTVTAFQLRLFPTASGDLLIGSWEWKGTVRGHTSSGAQSLEIERATSPIRIHVKPLPEPPSTFRGAVGEYAIDLRLESNELTQGIPGALLVEVSGTGNPVVLAPPDVPAEAWFRLGDPIESVIGTDGGSDQFVKTFRFELMPLGAGEFVVPPVSLTYFSPAGERYKVVRTKALPVTVKVSGRPEELVVIGAGGREGGVELAIMEQGRLPLATEVPSFRLRRNRWEPWPFLVGIPPLLYVTAVLWTRGLAGLWLPIRRRSRRAPVESRLGAALGHPQPCDALNATIREILGEHTGRKVAGLSVPEIEAGLIVDGAPDAAGEIAGVLRVCERWRYAGGQATADELEALAARAAGAIYRLGASHRTRGGDL